MGDSITMKKATAWSLTINNPTESDEDNISEARIKGWKVEGQKEQGENGTIHYQLLLKTPQVRFSAVKKAFPRAHIEIAKKLIALKQYVHKEDTRIAPLMTNDEKYPSPTKLMGLFSEYFHTEFKSISVKYHADPNTYSGDVLLKVFDDCIRDLISRGYYVEAHGVNPQIRGSIKHYGHAIILREAVNKQTQQQNAVQENLPQEAESGEGTEGSSEGAEEEGGEEYGHVSDDSSVRS